MRPSTCNCIAVGLAAPARTADISYLQSSRRKSPACRTAPGRQQRLRRCAEAWSLGAVHGRIAVGAHVEARAQRRTLASSPSISLPPCRMHTYSPHAVPPHWKRAALLQPPCRSHDSPAHVFGSSMRTSHTSPRDTTRSRPLKTLSATRQSPLLWPCAAFGRGGMPYSDTSRAT